MKVNAFVRKRHLFKTMTGPIESASEQQQPLVGASAHEQDDPKFDVTNEVNRTDNYPFDSSGDESDDFTTKISGVSRKGGAWPCFATGTMPYLEDYENNVFIGFISSSLRGCGQVTFLNNPLSGVLIIVASMIEDYVVGLCGLFSVLIAHLFVKIFQLDEGLLRAGLFGFNAYLVGLAFGTFHG